jgi:hypothetical protein
LTEETFYYRYWNFRDSRLERGGRGINPCSCLLLRINKPNKISDTMTQLIAKEAASERSIMEVTVFSAYNIDQLSQQDREALLETYQRSYKNSVWSDANPEMKEWYDSKDAKKWFTDASNFYADPLKKGGCEITLSKDIRSGKIIAALFTVSCKVFLENADECSRKYMEDVLKSMGAVAEKTVYIGEMFVNPEYRGAIGGMAIFKMAFELYAQMIAIGMEHVVAWTLDREDNFIIGMYKKMGLMEALKGKIEKGIDVFKSKYSKKHEYTKSCDGPVVFFYGTAYLVNNFLAKFALHRAGRAA